MSFNWLIKLWYIHTVDYYSILKGNKLLTQAQNLAESLENYAEWESQFHKFTYYVILLMYQS